ncbi:MmcQ/YjbR family DNA-binding protein [Nocardioides sp.]|uniref:MmcQ/YjbR family DNA-binding protein n=1 Tax=Nocardioides sp. TaxID=35761 RepID=UPI0026276BEE|nr:MmcQ/YjbR family DNA-binding protein [Nocardioides sp.]
MSGAGESTRPATPADVDALCRALPEVELGVSWGDRPTYKVPAGAKGKGFVLHRAPHRTAIDPTTGLEYDDLLVVRVPTEADKVALVASEGPFFTIDHFNGYNAVLVQTSRLGEITLAELREVITDAWRTVAPTRLLKEFDG